MYIMYHITLPEMGGIILGITGCGVLVYLCSWLRDCQTNEDYREVL